MGRIRARELGFDACMYMLHKTFGAPKGGGGPAVGAFGCTEELARFLPAPVVVRDGERYRLDRDRPGRASARCASSGATCRRSSRPTPGRARWARTGSTRPPTSRCSRTTTWRSGCSRSPGVTKSHPHLDAPRLEMTRYSLGELERETGIASFDVQNRMADYGDRRAVAQPRAVDRAGADHAGGRRDVVEGGYRLLDRRARAGLPRGATRIPSSSARRRTTRSCTSSPTRRSTIPTSGRRPGGRTSGSAVGGEHGRLNEPRTDRADRRVEGHRRRHGPRARARAGAHVIAHYGSDEAGARARRPRSRMSGSCSCGADFADPGAAARLWDAAVAWRGRIDVLVNNAAVMPATPLDAADADWGRGWEQALQVNVARAGRPDPRRGAALRRGGRRRPDHGLVAGSPSAGRATRRCSPTPPRRPRSRR